MDRWTVVLPLRGGQHSKTRLAAGLPTPHLAPALARAMAWDVMEAVVTTPRVAQVVLLTQDIPTGELPPHLVSHPRIRVGWDRFMPGMDPLNAAVTGWLASTRARCVAVVMPDLPCVTASDLGAALDNADASAPCFVPDQEDTGTVLLAGVPADLNPGFGHESARRHAESARRIQLDAPRLRRDVDTVADLTEAVRLGVGRHTAVLLADSGFTSCG